MEADFQNLLNKLNNLKGEGRQKAERKALKAVGSLIQEAIVARAPVQSGTPHGDLAPGELKADIKVRVHISKDEDAGLDSSSVSIGPGSKTSHIARFVENGHANPKATKGKKNTPAHPFIRVALDATREKAIDLYESVITEEINKAMK